ncbi:hypothetical protein [Pseudochryseolinea flava]|uniref:Cell division protein FtsL n=1 Tax=Pseudochryseolinea flava TaxID=2059302 RepID=A0A364Y689_9BACT|nr:hypothetical protein [Pseudochryseolinea flava]RAW01871.1 hypothetical protein DQQ10_09530 [Pseudochryseolinea flava]
MARNEIRIRRKPLSAGKLARYRNYESLMARHERDVRIKRLSKLILYVLIIVILVCTFLGVYIIREKQKIERAKRKAEHASHVHTRDNNIQGVTVIEQVNRQPLL